MGKTDWIDPETAALLLAQWENDEKFNNRSRKSKENRAKQVGPSYAGGSIPLSEHCRKIVSTRYFLLKYSMFCTLKQFVNDFSLVCRHSLGMFHQKKLSGVPLSRPIPGKLKGVRRYGLTPGRSKWR